MIRDLGPDDADGLLAFKCRAGNNFTNLAETLVHEVGRFFENPDAAANGPDPYFALGLDDGGELLAVAFASLAEQRLDILEIKILAVANGHKRSGLGRQLKEEMLRLAHEDPTIDTVISFVHRRNEPMLRLNEDLGAHIANDPQDPGQFKVCVFDVRSPDADQRRVADA